MVQILGALVIAFGVLLVLGGLTGRIKLTSCCSIADPRHDLRMRSAFEDEAVRQDGARSTQNSLPDGSS